MSKLFEIIWERIMHIGSVPICNGMASRAPHFFGFCFPLCYRCTFVILFTLLTIAYSSHSHKKMNWYLLFICFIPMIIDGSLQTFFGIESTNLRRMITGTIFGIGLGGLISYIYTWIDMRSF